MALTLYAHPLSSYSQKALVALYELDVPFELKCLDPSDQTLSGALQRLWPIGKFPVLVDNEQVVAESSLIIEYLDTLAGGGRLVPVEAAARMEMRLMDRVFDNYVATPQQKTIIDRLRAPGFEDPKGVEEAHALLEKTYAWLDEKLSGRAWAVGDMFTLADCGAAPMLFYADWVHPIGSRFSDLSSYFRRLCARPAVARVIEEGRPYHAWVPGGIPAHVRARQQ
jgi:glutathione S-transferase